MTDPARDPQRLIAWYENNALNERKQWNELTTRLYRKIDMLNGIIDSLKAENADTKDAQPAIPDGHTTPTTTNQRKEYRNE